MFKVLRILVTLLVLLLSRGRLVLLCALVVFFVGSYGLLFYVGHLGACVIACVVEQLENLLF